MTEYEKLNRRMLLQARILNIAMALGFLFLAACAINWILHWPGI